ncbi:Kelch repeat-containing protein [Longimicrobium sp.]|uniref:Kelch repeat-containing protein n=1 Tax=Longimicrobium sp. TaxID=2029185 RepID=UPI002EDA5E96
MGATPGLGLTWPEMTDPADGPDAFSDLAGQVESYVLNRTPVTGVNHYPIHDWGSGNVLPENARVGDTFWHTGLKCRLWNGGSTTVGTVTTPIWHQATLARVADRAARLVISASYPTVIFGGYQVQQIDDGSIWSWSGTDWKAVGAGAGGGGGRPVQETLTVPYAYDAGANQFTGPNPPPTGVQPAIPPFSTVAPSVGVYDNKMWVFGSSNTYTSGGVTGGLCAYYDFAANTWTMRQSMPTVRYGMAGAWSGGKFYAIAGYNGANRNDMYDPVTNTWLAKASIPTAVNYPAVAELDGKIYVIGGSTNTSYSGASNLVQVYDTVTNTWETRATMPTLRSRCAAFVYGGKIYVFGGLSNGSSTLGVLEMYDPATNIWVGKAAGPSTYMHSLLVHTAPAGAPITTPMVYVFGGPDYPNYISTYNPVTNIWQSLGWLVSTSYLFSVATSGPTQRYVQNGGAAVYGQRFWFIGGDGNAPGNAFWWYRWYGWKANPIRTLDGPSILAIMEPNITLRNNQTLYEGSIVAGILNQTMTPYGERIQNRDIDVLNIVNAGG